VKSPAEMKGFKFGVPFDFAMHNFLLRYYLAEGGGRSGQGRADPPRGSVLGETRGLRERAARVPGQMSLDRRWMKPTSVEDRALVERIGPRGSPSRLRPGGSPHLRRRAASGFCTSRPESTPASAR